MGCKQSTQQRERPQSHRFNAVEDDPPPPEPEPKPYTYTQHAPPQEKEEDNKEMFEDDDAQPLPISKYVLGGPKGIEGQVFECFKGGLLYRIVAKDGRWAFYNDSPEHEMHVSWKFGPRSRVKALGKTKMASTLEGWFDATVVVFPGNTEMFVEGQYDGFKSAVSAQPLSDEYRDLIAWETTQKVQKELRMQEQLVGKNASEEYALEACVQNGVPFVDPAFVPGSNSLSRHQIDTRQLLPCGWQRPTDYLPQEAHQHIRICRKIEPNDIDQGALGDCWFLCSVASLAEFPAKIKDMFSHPVSVQQSKDEAAVGAYRVTINKHGWWHVVILDSYLPTVGGVPCFAKNREDPAELWVSLIEKCYAKIHGSYASITGGDALHALQDLSGYPINRFDTEWEEALKNSKYSLELFHDLMRYDKEGYLINLNTPGQDTSNYIGGGSNVNSKELEERYSKAGLGMGHAYSVLQVKEFPTVNARLLQIRNPWGNGTEWTGAWGDDDPAWNKNPRIVAECNFKKEADGTFWMEWEDVKKYFDGGGVCFTKFNWFDYRAKGHCKNGIPNLVFEKDKRGLRDSDPDSQYAAMLLTVTKEAPNGKQDMHLHSSGDADKPTDSMTFNFARDVSLLYTFQPSSGPYLVVPRFYEAPTEKSYVLGMITDRPIGDGITVKFKSLSSDCKIFRNYPRFPYEGASDLETSFQFNPERGVPITAKGSSFRSKK